MPAALSRILALDLRKFTTILCVMDVATRKHRCEPFVTSPAGIEAVLSRHATADCSRTLVVIATSDSDAANCARQFCVNAGLRIQIANRCRDEWPLRRMRRNAERENALRLARLALRDQIPQDDNACLSCRAFRPSRGDR